MTRVRIIGAALDLGASRRGVDMGPSAIRIAGVAERLRALGHEVDDAHNVQATPREELQPTTDGSPHFLQAITTAALAIADHAARAVRDGYVPLVLGGDHSLAAGSVAGVATAFAERGERLGLIWLDAHSDIHLPQTSESGNVHGMPVAHLLGRGNPGLSTIARPGP